MIRRVIAAFALVFALAAAAPGLAQNICPPWGCEPPPCEKIWRCVYIPWIGWYCWQTCE